MEKEGQMAPKVTQIGVVVKNLDETMRYYSSVLGIGPFRIIELDVPEATVHGKPCSLKLKLAFAKLGELDLELIEVPEGESLYREFLQAKGEGLHHLGYYIEDFDAEMAKYEKQGIGVLQSGKSERARFAYMDTERIGGVIFEFVHRVSGLPGE